MALWDSFLRDEFNLRGYPNKSQALRDAITALEQYKTLKPILKNCSLPDGQNKELVCLDGTIPVNYQGSTYNIPISIWLQEKHPHVAPFAFVVPTAEMEIKTGQHVDVHGRVYLPFLTEWKHPQSDLYGLIQVLCLIFAEQPPVFARSRPAPTPSLDNNQAGPVEMPMPGMPQGPTQQNSPYPTTTPTRPSAPKNLPMAHWFSTNGYPNKSQALRDAKTALEQYKTLKPILKNCSLPDGRNKELVCLDGTIPVNHRGSTHNIPISIWLQEKHPHVAPFAFVVPTAEMEIKTGQHVDVHGRVYLPFLTEWKHPQSDLYGLIQVLCLIFAEQPPVFARSRPAPTPSLDNNQAGPVEMPMPGMPQGPTQQNSPYPTTTPTRPSAPKNLPMAHWFSTNGYPNKSQALRDAKTALEQYKTLKPILKNCSLPDGRNKELVCLDGTIPVNHRGSTYNIPISIWLQEKHPHVAPFAFVVPTAEMEIKTGQHVDVHGRVYLPFLTEWKHPQSDLYGLIQVLCLIFAEQPPVFARSRPAPYYNDK